jgi:hypothetical protein
LVTLATTESEDEAAVLKRLEKTATRAERMLSERDMLIVKAFAMGASLRRIADASGMTHVGVKKLVERSQADLIFVNEDGDVMSVVEMKRTATDPERSVAVLRRWTVLHRFLPSRKGGKEGAAPLSRPLEQVLTECIGGRTTGPLLLNQYGNRMTRSNAQRILDTASKNVRGRMPRLSPHVLRHTWCTLAVQAGASLERIQHDGGWADTRMAEYYCHTKHDPLNATTHLVAAHVFSAN